MPKQPRQTSISIEEAMRKLNDASESVTLRGVFRTSESKRISHAISLAEGEALPLTSKANEREDSYRVFLTKVKEACGVSMVVLCVVGLGKSAIAGMRDSVRLRLPLSIKKQQHNLNTAVLNDLSEQCFTDFFDLQNRRITESAEVSILNTSAPTHFSTNSGYLGLSNIQDGHDATSAGIPGLSTGNYSKISHDLTCFYLLETRFTYGTDVRAHSSRYPVYFDVEPLSG
jgi:hypothetical protein